MQTRLIRGSGQSPQRLLVYCAGWGTSASAIEHLRLPEHTDLLVCWDYRDLSLSFNWQEYAQRELVAWSMGVWAAEQSMADWSFSRAYAVNGTPYPKHSDWGIDPQVFMATLASMNADGRAKFERRMCQDAAQLARYQALAARPLEEIREELAMINQQIELNAGIELAKQIAQAGSIEPDMLIKPEMLIKPDMPIKPEGIEEKCCAPAINWSGALIAQRDRIIPSAHQERYWQTYGVPIRKLAGAHYHWDLWQSWEQIWQS